MVIDHLELRAVEVHAFHIDSCQYRKTLPLYLPIALLCLGEGSTVVDDGPVL